MYIATAVSSDGPALSPSPLTERRRVTERQMKGRQGDTAGLGHKFGCFIYFLAEDRSVLCSCNNVSTEWNMWPFTCCLWVFVTSCIFSLATQTWQALEQGTNRDNDSLSIS